MKRTFFAVLLGLLGQPLFATSDQAYTGESPPPASSAAEKKAANPALPPPPSPPPSADKPAPPPKSADRIATLATADLKEFDTQPAVIQRLIEQALALTRQNLGYQYGSADPKNGGMDCSGTIYHLLTTAGLADVPRDSAGMYTWVWKSGGFQAVLSSNPKTFELDRLKPGDLMFWTGTYDINRDPPVTHVMLYLGTNRKTGRRVMFGASEGRTFDGKARYGVSVFDFRMPSALQPLPTTSPVGERQSRFVGYGSIPDLDTLKTSAPASP